MRRLLETKETYHEADGEERYHYSPLPASRDDRASSARHLFDLQIDEEPLDVVWEAYHRTMTLILTSNGLIEARPVSEEELDKAMSV